MVVRKTNRHRKRRALTPGQLDILCKGTAFPAEGTHEFYTADGCSLLDPDRERVTAFWREVREEILPLFIKKFPGYRPYAWWLVDAPEPQRRMLRGAMDGRLRLHFGRRQAIFGRETIVETQAAYLDRHGLLTDEEREAIGDFEKEEACDEADFPCEGNTLIPLVL